MSRYSGPACQPRSVKIFRLAGVLGRAREDHVKQRSRRHSRPSDCSMHTPVTRSPRPFACAFSLAESEAFGLMSVATTIRRTCPRGRECEDTCAGALILSPDALAGQIERVEETMRIFSLLMKIFSGGTPLRPHAQAKARRVGLADILPRQDKLVLTGNGGPSERHGGTSLDGLPGWRVQSWRSIQLWRRCRPGSHHPFNGPLIGSSDFKSLRFQGKVEMRAAP